MILECSIDAIGENDILKENISSLIVLLRPRHQDYSFDFENGFENYPFIFYKDSWIARDIINHPQQHLKLDLRDFQLRPIKFDDVQQKFGYFHSELISEISSRQARILNFEKKIADSLKECIFSFHPEMYLYFILKLIWARELNHSADYGKIKPDFFFKYLEVVAVIFMNKFKLRLPNHDEIPQSRIEEIEVKYSDAIEFADDILDAIRRFIAINEEAMYVSVKMLQDQKYIHNDYIQRLLAESYEEVIRRIRKYENSIEYFGQELIVSDKRIELKIFPTPFGFTQIEDITDLLKQKKLVDLFKNYMAKNCLEYLGNDYLKDRLNTIWVFKHKEIISPLHVDRDYKLWRFKLNRQKRNNLFGSIFGQGQINLSTAFVEQQRTLHSNY
jgi:uncharacterized protein YlzI (FlbEa/FlbD family)